jgi:hypothetical protein
MTMYFAATLTALALCAPMSAQTKPDQAPSGTVVDQQHGANNEVQPAPEQVHLTPDVIRSAQQKMNDEGYKSGTVDGKMGPVTAERFAGTNKTRGSKRPAHWTRVRSRIWTLAEATS